ncbi:MAG TPA: FAD-dependent oxidoreductase [Candidatus Acidoferrales bacterium]|nr:FAD-dependent oxidoreductase [Candidatus Acidoferrales bacterium]
MSGTRRDFLKFVVAGSVATGCPIDMSLLAAPDDSKTQIEGDNFEICHQVRDGHSFSLPPISKRYDVVIVGGGASGLSAAYFLRQRDFLLLEKEPHFGGNAYLEEHQGQAFATGSAYDEKGTSSEQLAREIGLTMLPVNSFDPTILNGNWIKDTWHGGLDELPYPASVRDSFKKFRADMLAIDITKNIEQLDNTPLAKYLSNYAPEVKSWWDSYGPSNWGAKSADTSAYVALIDFQEVIATEKDVRVTLPGGNGALSRKLVQSLQPKSSERLVGDATIVAVEPQKNDVRVTYVKGGSLHSVGAKFVIMATPKFITARIVAGLSDAQLDAMSSYHYCPYPVINMIFDKPVYNRGYDTWCPGNSFTDFIVADWVVQKQPEYKQKSNILTFYTPLAEIGRKKLLKVDDCRQIAASVLHDFQKLLPEFAGADPLEVHFYRRGHPMFMATPGTFTKVTPAARQPLERVFFANTDSIGPESEISGAVDSARKAAEWVEKRLAGASAAAAQAVLGLRA